MTLFEKFSFLKPVLSRLFKLLNKRQKALMAFMLVLIIGFSLVETIGISAIMPFISVVSNPSLLEDGIYKKAYELFNFSSTQKFIIIFGIAIIIFYIFRGIYFIILSYLTKKYSNSIYKYFAKKALKINLSVPYKVHAQKNTGELMHAIGGETKEIGTVVFNLLYFLTEIFSVLMVYALIIFLNWKMTLILTCILFIFIIIFMSYLTRVNSKQGKIRFITQRKMSRSLKESLGNIKYVKLKGNEEEVIKTYNDALESNAKSELITDVLNSMPKGVLESLGFSFLIGVVITIVWLSNDASIVIPIISMYALALYRILPSVHRLLINLNKIVYGEEIIKNVYENLNQKYEEEGSVPVNFESSIRLENINFKYMTGNEIISNLSLEIKKGDKTAFTGESGGGKSTLIDIITGIHKPISGNIYIDNTLLTNENIRSWRKKIGYIPQSVYLFDGTVAENVSFGSDYNEDKIITALKKANIWDFLSQKEGINTLVGDGGIQLSGGQQQRICIARAIYDDPEVLVLDEATSALDNETEQRIMDEIYSVSTNKTLLVIAHRLTTVERCDRRICIKDGMIEL